MARTLREKIQAHIQMLEQEYTRLDTDIASLSAERKAVRLEITRLNILLKSEDGETDGN